MPDLIDQYIDRWAGEKIGRPALIAIFYHIRDIPYGILPELNDPHNYLNILNTNMGSCTPKHLLLGEIYSRLGMEVLFSVFPYRWSEFEELYPPYLRKLARLMPPASHLACRVFIDGRYVLIDATIDPPLGRLGLPVNMNWDGFTDTVLPVLPTGEEEIYHPLEVSLMQPPSPDDTAMAFYNGLNQFFEKIRNGQL